MILAAGQFLLVTVLPVPVALATVFALILGNFIGASNWYFSEWHLGWPAPIAYSVLLCLGMALALRRSGLREKLPQPGVGWPARRPEDTQSVLGEPEPDFLWAFVLRDETCGQFPV